MARFSSLLNIAGIALAMPVAQIQRALQEEARAENYQFPPDSRADRDGAPSVYDLSFAHLAERLSRTTGPPFSLDGRAWVPRPFPRDEGKVVIDT